MYLHVNAVMFKILISLLNKGFLMTRFNFWFIERVEYEPYITGFLRSRKSGTGILTRVISLVITQLTQTSFLICCHEGYVML
jgi:hypothetical protein